MKEVFKIPILRLHPSQLYINESKLQRLKHLAPEQLSPIPVIQIGQDIVLSDGHTRTLHAFLNGRKEIDVYWDQDELDIIPIIPVTVGVKLKAFAQSKTWSRK